MAAMIPPAQLQELQQEKARLFAEFIEMNPPHFTGEDLVAKWEELYDDTIASAVVKTSQGPSSDDANPVFPYEKLRAVLGDGGNWKWPRMWRQLDALERRGAAYRQDESLNFGLPNKNPGIRAQRCLVVGGGPCGLRLGIELALAGHSVMIFEKRREERGPMGELKKLGFTCRINRLHMYAYIRQDLANLNGKEFMSREACYPVFTEPETTSIGVHELQCLLLKNALLLGVDFRLGACYSSAKPRLEAGSLLPQWRVECSYDEMAATRYLRSQQTSKAVEDFDALIGCDGGRSGVRLTQAKHFGDVERKKFVDLVGIVANVQKVSRKRLRELGFEYGQEPSDMNRTKLAFPAFFKEVQDKAGADIETLIYYKASHYNYLILVPKREDLVRHGLSGRVYHFGVVLERAAQDARSEEKVKLKRYVRKILDAVGIPIDDQLENGGYVEAPNDVMAFDFSECWTTTTPINFNFPALVQGDATGHRGLVGRQQSGAATGSSSHLPFLAVCGDSVQEPFWPLGLGISRGWQGVMDTCYALDNLYNKSCYTNILGKPEDAISWQEHFEMHREQLALNFKWGNKLQISPELSKGEYDDQGLVVSHWHRFAKECEKPTISLEVDPYARYEIPAKERMRHLAALSKDPTWIHPRVQRLHNMCRYYEEVEQRLKKGQEVVLEKRLISLNGLAVALHRQFARGLRKLPTPMAPLKAWDLAQEAKEHVERRCSTSSVSSSSTVVPLHSKVPANLPPRKKAELAMLRVQIENLSKNLAACHQLEREILASAAE
eukprot:CAMPEP_0206448696 /NCGR_PEP_ID=MMETSP0324_2-20121206/17630_1 /ASSEMBLY_ACC=CAM_ASM_000836 /TAXON_ID=2866 /ORGANISM="Crypthecodinium cohnii, Strain Seligo" /LENGTH=778 /DNA_ID=CAMNT_0053917897 /DNA_START=78 /DNA_END=2414 /DNA_ORIENTATION=+